MSGSSVRDIIEIDEEKCDGCGLCVPNCAEGALAVIDGKLRILDDARCDGAGACIGHCPQGALRVIKRQAPAFDEKFAVTSPQPKPFVQVQAPRMQPHHPAGGGCPGSRAMAWDAPKPAPSASSQQSALTQWPVQLHLLSPAAAFFSGRELLLAADCVAFAAGGFHAEMLAGRSLAIACPKLDDPEGYVEKLATILRSHEIPAVRVAIMEVPCCQGLAQMAMMAVQQSGFQGEVELIVVSRFGEVVRRNKLQQPACATAV
jgi:NAD-dependent dihydropyrimidine dehydrogenase PreA subunit